MRFLIPPGVLCVQPGECWSKTACDYFLALEEGINKLPGFAPEIQGVYITEQPDGTKKAFGYVLKKEFENNSSVYRRRFSGGTIHKIKGGNYEYRQK